MILNPLFETSNSAKLFRRISAKYISFTQKLNKVYKNSQTDIFFQDIWRRIKTYFKYSFLERISDICKKENSRVLDKSELIRYLANIYVRHKQKIYAYGKNSGLGSLLKKTKKETALFPLNRVSIIIVAATLTHTVFSVIFKKDIELWNWIMRVLIIFIGLSGSFCRASWQEVKRTSYFLRYVFKG